MDAQLKRGVLDVCVLASMRKKDTYGYQIIKDILPYIEISESTLYPILKRLEQSGCVVSYTSEHNGRLRKYYHLTSIGRTRIDEFLSAWDSVMLAYSYIKGDLENEQEGISEKA